MEDPSGSAASTSPKVRSQVEWPLLVSTAVVALAVVAIAAFALSRLVSRGTTLDLILVCQEVLKTSYQALAAGALGA
jgi:hypothetical protein